MHKMNGEMCFVLSKEGVFLHIFWSCEHLHLNFETCCQYISLCMHYDVSLNSGLCLLGTNRQDSWSSHDKIHTDLALLAARKSMFPIP